MKTHRAEMQEIPLGTLPWNLVDTPGAAWRWEGRRLTLLVDETTIAIVDLERKVLLIDVPLQRIQVHKGEK
ncbi:MAG TPA: hypothetical protein VH540_01855 [Ktedonobacterales bacterium]